MKPLLLAVTTLCLAASATAQAPIVFTRLTIHAAADLSRIAVTYHITPRDRSFDAAVQLFAHRDDIRGRDQ